MRFGIVRTLALCLASALVLYGVRAEAAPDEGPPSFIEGPIFARHFGVDNDLLTAGLGWTGIASGVAPSVSDPPTRDELRRLAIYNSMRGLISTSTTEGFGSIYGTLGRVPGTEYTVFVRGPDGPAATLLVQIPDALNTKKPCIVTAPSSGSRGIYGAISNAEVAFRNGCAVAYTDKGTGVGFHDLTRNIVYDIFGNARAASALKLAHYRAKDTAALRQFKQRFPNRIAIKHAYSGTNPEKDWGRFVLQSIHFAIWAMNIHRDRGGRYWGPADVLVIAAGVSNGGGAALLAGEQDREALIDGIVVSEPQVQPRPNRNFSILDRGQRIPLHSRSLYDVTTFMDVYADCAGVSTNPVTPATPGAARCLSLKARGLLNATILLDQILEARRRIHDYGLLADADGLLPTHASLHLWRILAAVYGNAYARAAVGDHLCRMSFASTGADGTVVPWDLANVKKAFATANGLPAAALAPAGGGPFIVDDGVYPPKNELTSTDLNLDGALCWRALVTSSYLPTTRLPTAAQRNTALQSIAALRAGGDLQGKPTIILHGRKDALVAPNHSSRAYFGLNQLVGRGASRVRYIEVANGNHFDAFIPLYPALGAPGQTLVAMHGYFNHAIDTMLRHLRTGAPLPESQVFAATEETCALPNSPSAENRIRFASRTLVIPAGTPPTGC